MLEKEELKYQIFILLIIWGMQAYMIGYDIGLLIIKAIRSVRCSIGEYILLRSYGRFQDYNERFF